MIRHPVAAWCGLSVAAALMLGDTLTPALAQAGLPPAFVYLRDVEPTIVQDIRYAGRDNFTGRPLPGYDAPECILTRAVATALKQVQSDLAAAGLGLKVYDCYRPARATQAMVQWTRDGRTDTQRFYPALQKSSLLHGYISGASRHATGMAVDLTLVELARPTPAAFDPGKTYGACNGPAEIRSPDSSLDMGTGYDCFDPLSHTNNAAIGGEQRRRRMVLVAAMSKRGFRNYAREWWHFTFAGAASEPAQDFPIARR